MVPIAEGHICKKCGSDQSKVYETREVEAYGFRKIRRRECKDCGFRWVTTEVYFWDIVEHLQKQ